MTMKPPLFSCLTSRVANNGSLYGRFLFGPLPIDISLTVATVLRRSLLHTQAVFTIISAEIEGAYHEYASLPGIQESVLEILLNLGEIVLTTSHRNFLSPNFRTYYKDSPFDFAFIRISGPGIITAKDINWPKGIFCVKPNAVIATLSSNETLTMRLKIACSINKNKIKEQELAVEVEPKAEKSYTSANTVDQTNSLNLKEGTSLDQQNKQNTLVKNKEIKLPFLTNNQNKFESFKLKGKSSSLTLINSLDSPLFSSTSLTSHFMTIQKKNLLNRQIKGFVTNKNTSRLLYEQTKNTTQKLLTKNIRASNSYTIRKQNLIETSVSSSTNKYNIFFKNTSEFFRSSVDVKNQNNEKLLQNNVIFRVFPTLVNNFIDITSLKKETKSSVSKISSNQEVELDILNKANSIEHKQQSFFLNTEINTENSLPSSKKKENRKYELQVKSSNYPVEKVNFLIERDDELAGYRHRIILEVWTNGSISPRQAIFESIGSIIKLIYNFREPLRNYFIEDNLIK